MEGGSSTLCTQTFNEGFPDLTGTLSEAGDSKGSTRVAVKVHPLSYNSPHTAAWQSASAHRELDMLCCVSENASNFFVRLKGYYELDQGSKLAVVMELADESLEAMIGQGLSEDQWVCFNLV